MRRRGVVASHREHNPGAFAVQMAPIRALVEAPARRRERPQTGASPVTLEGLSHDTIQLLRDLAERSLNSLGVAATDHGLTDEMHRHLRLILPSLSGGERMEAQLRAALKSAMAEYD
jgi:hypothetical protein